MFKLDARKKKNEQMTEENKDVNQKDKIGDENIKNICFFQSKREHHMKKLKWLNSTGWKIRKNCLHIKLCFVL